MFDMYLLTKSRPFFVKVIHTRLNEKTIYIDATPLDEKPWNWLTTTPKDDWLILCYQSDHFYVKFIDCTIKVGHFNGANFSETDFNKEPPISYQRYVAQITGNDIQTCINFYLEFLL